MFVRGMGALRLRTAAWFGPGALTAIAIVLEAGKRWL